jgi:hypothetical protein
MVKNQKKYNLPNPWNKKYARCFAQARFRKEEWAFTPETWYQIWEDSKVKEQMGRGIHHYCMVRVDATEAWGPHNTIIIPRRMHMKKKFYECVHHYPKTDYDPQKHAFYCPPETLVRYNNAE